MQFNSFLLIKNDNFFFKLYNIYKKYIYKILLNEKGSVFIYINISKLYLFSKFIKNSLLFNFTILHDIVVVDCFWRFYRFELYYNYLSVMYIYRLFFVIRMFITNKFPYGFGICSLID